MAMKMKESKFGAPAGIYVGKFLGVVPFKGDGKPRVGRDGKPMGPAVEWQFEITEGEQAGQMVGRLTSPDPTTKNACGTLLSGLIGKVLRADEEAEPGNYVGMSYQIVIGPSKDNPEKTHVVQIVQLKGAAAPAAPAGKPTPPPGRAPAPAPAASTNGDDPAKKAAIWAANWWVQRPADADPQRLTGQQLQLFLNAAKSQAEVDAIMVMDDAQSKPWQKPSAFGFAPEVPF